MLLNSRRSYEQSIIYGGSAVNIMHDAPHPGEILKEYLEGSHLKLDEFSAVIDGQASITKDIASELALHFDTSVEFWLNLQMQYDQSLVRSKLNQEGNNV